MNYVSFNPPASKDNDCAYRLAALPKSVQYGLRSFPEPAAYHALVAEIVAQDPTVDRHRLECLAQRDWHVRGQNGCQFARLAALNNTVELLWDYCVVLTTGHDKSRRLLYGIDECINNAIESRRVEVLSLLFPDLSTPDDLEWVIRELATHTNFFLEYDGVSNGMTHLKLRYPVSNKVRAWVMAFCPFNFVPNTRRSPYVELAIRVKEKRSETFHRNNQDRDVAHLADFPLEMSDRHWEDRWFSTMRRTRMILGHDPDQVSAAKATFSAPVRAE